MLGILECIIPASEIFKKNYRPAPSLKRHGINMPVVQNQDGFFDDLPALSFGEMKKRGNSSLFLTKQERLEQKLHKLEER